MSVPMYYTSLTYYNPLIKNEGILSLVGTMSPQSDAAACQGQRVRVLSKDC